ncbi:hypothetical protein DZC52_11415 [Wenzhouxiangella sediminis]|uniref:Uncharacterized protein n=1 Tax=Wenzhouxiangella sediminis TaxID=1792836 RepID=A0A3E1K6W8_9GAMM|nr:hypothetical protein DZC52_11415 [Wenzhouxiangella sediminis]
MTQGVLYFGARSDFAPLIPGICGMPASDEPQRHGVQKPAPDRRIKVDALPGWLLVIIVMVIGITVIERKRNPGQLLMRVKSITEFGEEFPVEALVQETAVDNRREYNSPQSTQAMVVLSLGFLLLGFFPLSFLLLLRVPLLLSSLFILLLGFLFSQLPFDSHRMYGRIQVFPHIDQESFDQHFQLTDQGHCIARERGFVAFDVGSRRRQTD